METGQHIEQEHNGSTSISNVPSDQNILSQEPNTSTMVQQFFVLFTDPF